MAKRSSLSPSEWEYIRSKCLTESDEKIAKALSRDIRTVQKARVKLGIRKKIGGGVANIESPTKETESILAAGQGLDEEQRKQYFKTQFVNSLYYTNLKNQFTKEELDFYLEEWGTLCLQFEDIVGTEKRQIDEYIKLALMGNRILDNVKIIEEEITMMQEEIDEWREEHPDIETDKLAQERDNMLMDMVRSMNAEAKSMSIDYQRNLDARMKILGELNARRKDRVDQLTKRGTTFLGLIEAFRERKIREDQGRNMELFRMAKEKKKKEWRKPIRFPDGAEDCILMDSKSELPHSKVVRLEDLKSKVVDKFKSEKGKKILIVDDDKRRTQFFGDVFKENDLHFASNADKAIALIKEGGFDLICLDYDLGMEQKGTKVAEEMTIEGVVPSTTEVLVHSMNKVGAAELQAKLAGQFGTLEVFPFEDLVKIFNGDRDAKSDISSRTS